MRVHQTRCPAADFHASGAAARSPACDEERTKRRSSDVIEASTAPL